MALIGQARDAHAGTAQRQPLLVERAALEGPSTQHDDVDVEALAAALHVEAHVAELLGLGIDGDDTGRQLAEHEIPRVASLLVGVLGADADPGRLVAAGEQAE